MDYTTCLLSAPAGAEDVYASADVWKEFYNIEETASINDVSADMQDKSVSGYYSIDEKRINTPVKGINIIKYYDGTSKKIMR